MVHFARVRMILFFISFKRIVYDDPRGISSPISTQSQVAGYENKPTDLTK